MTDQSRLKLVTAWTCPNGIVCTWPFWWRSRTERSDIPSTVPRNRPVSIYSPTRKASSIRKKRPEMMSRTRLCAPKPIAMPTTPRPARSGPMSRPRVARATMTATTASPISRVLRTSGSKVSSREAEPGISSSSPGAAAGGIFSSITALSAVHRIQAATTVAAASRAGRTNSLSMLPDAGSTRSRPQVSPSQAAPRIHKNASESRLKARCNRARRRVILMSVASQAQSRAIKLWLACPITATPTTMPCVAVEARATQAPPFPRANSIVAAMSMPSDRAMKNQCQDAATARRIGPGSPPVAARIARPIGRRGARQIDREPPRADPCIDIIDRQQPKVGPARRDDDHQQNNRQPPLRGSPDQPVGGLFEDRLACRDCEQRAAENNSENGETADRDKKPDEGIAQARRELRLDDRPALEQRADRHPDQRRRHEAGEGDHP